MSNTFDIPGDYTNIISDAHDDESLRGVTNGSSHEIARMLLTMPNVTMYVNDAGSGFMKPVTAIVLDVGVEKGYLVCE